MTYIGDFIIGQTFDHKFCTVQSTGAPSTLGGTPVVSAYVGNSTTQITAGITLTADFDSVTGLNNVRVVATEANGYAPGANYQLVITTGTVNSVSAVGYVVGSFSIMNRYTPGLKGTGTAAGGSTTTIILASGAGAALDVKAGDYIVCVIDGTIDAQTVNSIATDTATMDGAWGGGVAPDTDDPYWVFAGGTGLTSTAIAAAVWANTMGTGLGSKTAEQALTAIGGLCLGNTSGLTSGAGTLTIKDWAGNTVATFVISNDGNRSGLSLS